MTLVASAPIAASTSHLPASVPHAIPLLPADASWLSIAQACVPIAIAAMVAWVGWRQLETAKAKLNLDLFNERMAIFDAVQAFIKVGASQASVPEQQVTALLEMAPKARFLMGQQADGYIQELTQKNFEMNRLLVERHKAGNIMNSPQHQAVMECQLWFSLQMVQSAKLFQPFLSFERWR